MAERGLIINKFPYTIHKTATIAQHKRKTTKNMKKKLTCCKLAMEPIAATLNASKLIASTYSKVKKFK